MPPGERLIVSDGNCGHAVAGGTEILDLGRIVQALLSFSGKVVIVEKTQHIASPTQKKRTKRKKKSCCQRNEHIVISPSYASQLVCCRHLLSV